MCDTVTSQGIVAIVDIPATSFEDVSPPPQMDYPLYLILDGVLDPGNLGTLLQSSLFAVGVAGVPLLPKCCDVWSLKVVAVPWGPPCSFPLSKCCPGAGRRDWNSCSPGMLIASIAQP
jgi:tRNA G18 (ribose-2'-O)-methylase SpoU